MTNMLGNKYDLSFTSHSNKRILVDSDALIGLIHESDLLYKRCLQVAEYLNKNNFYTIIPYPIVLEATTALARDKTIRRSHLAKQLLNDYSETGENYLETGGIFRLVAQLYNPKTSKKNSPFDYYLLALAKKNNISLVFSFDLFYKRNGLTLIEDIISR